MLLLWFLCLLWVLSVADKCGFNYSNLNVSSALDSLKCHNNYQTYFDCTWREEPERNSARRLQLLFHRGRKTYVCEDYPSDVEGTRACRCQIQIFSLFTSYTVFFDYPLKLCSSIRPERHDLSQLLRASSPVNLTTSSPYPQSSALNKDMPSQVDSRSPGHDSRADELSGMQTRLDEFKLTAGHNEARTRGILPQKNYQPTAIYQPPSITEPVQVPRVDCVQQEVQGEQETRCSWEQSIELGHFISYQLVCHRNHTATPQECCQDKKVSSGHKKDTVNFSCRIELTPPSTVLLELVPKRNAKSLRTRDNIRPDPPTAVTVTKKDQNYVVKWTHAWTSEGEMDFDLEHEVRYYSQEDEEDAETIRSDSYNTCIPRSALQPSRKYWVKVRSLVKTSHVNIPSEWSFPKDWETPPADTWQNWIYAVVAVVVSALFIKLLVFPACTKRVVVWMESAPSPVKSKALLDIKTENYPKLMITEETYLCKVMDIDSVSTCYSVKSLWPDKRLDSEDEGVWSCDNLLLSPLDKSSLSFSGPYILCPPAESKPKEKPVEVSWPVVGCPVTMMTFQSEEEYVRLPCPTVSASVEHLPSQSHRSTGERSSRDTEGDREEDTERDTEEDTEGDREKDTKRDTEEDQPHLTQGCVFEAFWPQGGAILGSGYCQLPSDFTHTYSQS